MLPYLPPFERLMVALRRTNLGQWFRDFLADPVDLLIRKGAKKVILGSRSSWDGTVLNKIPKECSWVTSAGVKSKYHPSPSVVQDIVQSGRTVFKSNELNEISVRGAVLA